MLFIPELNITIDQPESINEQTVAVKNHLFEKLRRGLVFFIIPEDFKNVVHRNSVHKKHIKNYKIGFLYDALSIVYPAMGKEDKYEVISDAYHLFFTYRQFKSLLDEYNGDRKKYLKVRNLL